MPGYALKMLAEDAETFTVGNYGIVFDGRDLTGDFFTKDSDLWLDKIPSVPTLYEHGLDPLIGPTVLGTKGATRVDDLGVWVERQIDKSNKYAEAVKHLAERGRLGYSSGAIAHLVQRMKGGWLKSWPVAEWTLTPDPAEPRTLGLTVVKSVAFADGVVDLAVKATWTAATINDLPDSSFLYIEDGGDKDSEGKTTPRSLRHFPYKDADGKVDLPHLRNALARIPQSDLPSDVKDRVRAKAEKIAADNGVGDGGGQGKSAGFALTVPEGEARTPAPETKAGRVMSQKNLDAMHTGIATLTGVHAGVCDMGDACPMSGNPGRQGGKSLVLEPGLVAVEGESSTTFGAALESALLDDVNDLIEDWRGDNLISAAERLALTNALNAAVAAFTSAAPADLLNRATTDGPPEDDEGGDMAKAVTTAPLARRLALLSL